MKQRFRLGLQTVAVLVGVTSALPAAAAVGAWAEGNVASARLIAEGIDESGRLNAGIEVILPAGWKTYWRTPGDAGIAPLFDFSASQNLHEANVSFPLPHRFDDGYSISNVYAERVIFPVVVVVEDPDAPVTLDVAVDLGVCEEICVPDRVEPHLTVEPGSHDATVARTLERARMQLPGPPERGEFWVTGVERSGGTDKRPVFRVSAIVPNPEGAEVYVEGPEDWYPEVPDFAGAWDDRADWTVRFSRLGARTPIRGAVLTVTIVSGERSIEQTVDLD